MALNNGLSFSSISPGTGCPACLASPRGWVGGLHHGSPLGRASHLAFNDEDSRVRVNGYRGVLLQTPKTLWLLQTPLQAPSWIGFIATVLASASLRLTMQSLLARGGHIWVPLLALSLSTRQFFLFSLNVGYSCSSCPAAALLSVSPRAAETFPVC